MSSDSTSTPPRISVVIPCFDDGTTVVETMASVRAQEPCEVVVVDDGSTDEHTLEVLRGFEAEGILVIHQENGGPAKARTAGVAATSSRYVFPLDADDVLEPDCLTALADALDAHPGRAMAWGAARAFGDTAGGVDHGVRSGPDPWRITYSNPFPYCALFRRSAVEDAGGWSLPGSYQDWDLWMALAERGYVGLRVPVLVLNYRVHSGRMWRAGMNRHEEIYANLRARHPRLFSERRANWRRSAEPLSIKLTYPLIDMLPGLSFQGRRRLQEGVSNPIITGRTAARRLRRLLP